MKLQMTWSRRRLPSAKTEYQIWVSVWKPLLVAQAHCDTRCSWLRFDGWLGDGLRKTHVAISNRWSDTLKRRRIP